MIEEGKNALADAERTVIEGGEKRNGDEGRRYRKANARIFSWGDKFSARGGS